MIDQRMVDAIVMVQKTAAEQRAPELNKEHLDAIALAYRPYIEPHDIRHVLWVSATVNNDPQEGQQPGSFTVALIDAIFRADPKNFGEMAMLWPSLCWAVWNYKHLDGGLEWLRERAKP